MYTFEHLSHVEIVIFLIIGTGRMVWFYLENRLNARTGEAQDDSR